MDGTGRREQAKPIYEQILKIEPDHPVALNNLAYIKAEEGVDLDEALTMAQRARQKLPNSAYIKDTLGWIYIKKNLSADAVLVFKDLVQEEPANPQFHYHYGMALLQKGDKPMAKKMFASVGIPVLYTNVFWGGRSEIKPSEISPIAYRDFCTKHGVDPDSMRE